MSNPHHLRQIKNSLSFANKLLLVALLIDLVFISVGVYRHFQPEWALPLKLFGVLYVPCALLGIVGFWMVNRQLELTGDAFERMDDFVDRTWLLGTAKIALGVKFFFFVSFLMPMFNLPFILFARSRAKRAIRAIDAAPRTRRG
jgi:hypothetical protein